MTVFEAKTGFKKLLRQPKLQTFFEMVYIFDKLNLLPPYSLRSQGDKNCWHTHSTVKILLEITVGDCRLLSHVLQNAAKEQKYSFRSVREISLQQGGILPFVQLSINCVVVVSQMKNILFIL